MVNSTSKAVSVLAYGLLMGSPTEPTCQDGPSFCDVQGSPWYQKEAAQEERSPNCPVEHLPRSSDAKEVEDPPHGDLGSTFPTCSFLDASTYPKMPWAKELRRSSWGAVTTPTGQFG